MEKERVPQFTIAEMTVDMIDEVTDMRLESWLDTYVNDNLGVTREWIETRNIQQRSTKRRQARLEQFTSGEAAGAAKAWVALDDTGKIIGATTPFVDDDGHQHIGSLYVDKAWHGKGVGGQLMQKVLEGFDPKKPVELGVVAYNERAKAFYRKWGFEEVEGSEKLFENLIPEVMMIRSAKEMSDEV